MEPFQRNPEDVADFVSESMTYLDEAEPKLASIRDGLNTPSKDVIDSFFRAFHSIKGVAGFLHFNQIQSITHRSEEILDDSRSGRSILNSDLADLLLKSIDVLKSLIDQIKNTGSDEVPHPLANELLASLEANKISKGMSPKKPGSHSTLWAAGNSFNCFLDRTLLEKVFEEATSITATIEESVMSLLDSPLDPKSFKVISKGLLKLRVNFEFLNILPVSEMCDALWIHVQNRIKDGIPNSRIDASLFANVLGKLPTIWENSNSISEIERRDWVNRLIEPIATSAPQIEVKPSENNTIASATPNKTSGIAEMRVGIDKLDKLVELIEELGVVAVGVSQSQASGESISRMLEGRLLQVTEALQELSIAVRQVPAGNILRRLVRVVGDVSKKLGKKIDLKILGEEVEMDREVLDALQDPLVHVVRNALDHGIEMPDDRVRTGKKDTGSLHIEAWHGNGEFCLSVVDDGKGVDRAKILAKGLEKGLVPPEANQWPDSKILGILLMPGFSTNEVVTEFSGRGVGMDVVAKTLENLRGRIDIESQLGKGSRFIFRIPLANALTESLVVSIGGLRYVLRISSIRETFHPPRNSLFRLPDGTEKIKLRDSLYTVVRLYTPLEKLERELFVLIENRGRQIALAIDEVLGKVQSVIKTKPAFLASAEKLSGFAIIGTASDDVAWSLDLDSIMPMELEAKRMEN